MDSLVAYRQSPMEAKRVVVTGLGVVTALGNNVKTTWDNLLHGKSGAGPITHFDASQFKTHFACEVKDLDPSNVMEQKEVRKHDRYSHLAMVAADEAMTDAAIHVENENALRCGVIMGSGMGGVHALDANIGEFASGDGTPRFSPFFIPMAIPNISAGLLAIRYGFRGINFATVSACASSSHAIATAYNYIRFGMADVMLTGGSEAAIEFAGIGGFNAVRALSTRNDDPEHASRPFSASRDGFVLGEGAGCLVLEEYSHAIARGAHIYAEVVGAGMTSDAYHIVASDPEGRGAAEAMALAVQEAGLKPADVEYINTHGTSTPIGDVAETKAIQQVFGDHAYDMNLTSSKSMTGHLLGGTGAVEAVISILSIVNQMVTPTINHADGDDDPAIDSRLNFTFNEAQPRQIHYALSNNFGFGGHNACLLFAQI